MSYLYCHVTTRMSIAVGNGRWSTRPAFAEIVVFCLLLQIAGNIEEYCHGVGH